MYAEYLQNQSITLKTYHCSAHDLVSSESQRNRHIKAGTIEAFDRHPVEVETTCFHSPIFHSFLVTVSMAIRTENMYVGLSYSECIDMNDWP